MKAAGHILGGKAEEKNQASHMIAPWHWVLKEGIHDPFQTRLGNN